MQRMELKEVGGRREIGGKGGVGIMLELQMGVAFAGLLRARG